LSAICPLSLGRIAIPSRGRNCKHPQCFDLASFLSFADQTSWFCPLCKNPVPWDELLIDAKLEEAIKLSSADVEEFKMTSSGSFVPVDPRPKDSGEEQSEADSEESLESPEAKRRKLNSDEDFNAIPITPGIPCTNLNDTAPSPGLSDASASNFVVSTRLRTRPEQQNESKDPDLSRDNESEDMRTRSLGTRRVVESEDEDEEDESYETGDSYEPLSPRIHWSTEEEDEENSFYRRTDESDASSVVFVEEHSEDVVRHGGQPDNPIVLD